ncbi:MAG: hypothetical protein LBL58_04070 [Tannerellaceae bacterium]|nr:hypothetical protein [Tannerellaceae bacterium]
MKSIIIFTCMLMALTASCHSSDESSSSEEEAALLNNPTDNVTVECSAETFTFGFTFDTYCELKINFDVLPGIFAELKTRTDLINHYKTLKSGFLPSYSSMVDTWESVWVKTEYMLAQECFSDQCGSAIRREVLQLAANHQKSKYKEYTAPWCTQKSGIFLMAVILAKERKSSAEIIDSATLQQALLCFSEDVFISEDYSNLIIEYSEKFLTDSKE